ncbi:branched-chain amino acid ABC transporter permease [Fulvimarina endophytica]|uniref:Branched-chain amino acid ABC transporter permease n=1 Tax=Fulvimarina endophytica TaxID=2293836 RepID=A0A371WZS8_9HYPH|nr:AzlC family ABC transporter permease [Fulvimarina endophytica]RFC62465.1 branched-chain amino acid ABC transporter permease [Fulvimarina endophytica]
MSGAHESDSDTKSAVRDVVPIILAIIPFGMVYGTVAASAQLSLVETIGFSASVYAGASQLAALQLVGIGAPVWSVLVTVFALNFRHVLYSASIGRHLDGFPRPIKALAFFLLVDPTFAAAEARAAKGALTVPYYLVYALLLYVCWLAASALGFVFGSLIEDTSVYGIDFVLPAYFLAMVMTFRSRAAFWPVASASAGASIILYTLVGPPWHVTLGALAGITVAACLPQRTGKSAAAHPADDPAGGGVL